MFMRDPCFASTSPIYKITWALCCSFSLPSRFRTGFWLDSCRCAYIYIYWYVKFKAVTPPMRRNEKRKKPLSIMRITVQTPNAEGKMTKKNGGMNER